MIPGFSAAKAVVDALLAVDGHRWRGLGVVWTERLEAASDLLHGHIVGLKEGHQVDAGFEGLNLVRFGVCRNEHLQEIFDWVA